jgi:hypothetical protein
MDEARKFGWCKSSPRLLGRMRSGFGSMEPITLGREDAMSNMKKPISTTSYDIRIAWTYAIISLLAVVAIYGLSTHLDTDAPATIASLHNPGS